MSDSDDRVVTGLMLGTFLAFGVDTILIVAALWYVGAVPASTATGVSIAILSVFLLWIAVRWDRLRRTRGTGATVNAGPKPDAEDEPIERLKRRYADGEISDEEFERRIDRLLDADSRIEAGALREDDPRERERETE
ncbi:SHOCT domain-containing protein [Halobaculum halobium]|uniref:SHOCT domain-containing protein n=1 Tax=Halobaculum halobium TaxID=3032281 RepID=A0ABD5TC63_9EURY|nr:SHOCT domain-containing protein [Halobaculum sp. SYNS20]